MICYLDNNAKSYTYTTGKGVNSMKKLLPLVMLMGFSSPAFADITHRMTSSVNLHTGAASVSYTHLRAHET